MSQNTDHYHMNTPTSISPSNSNNNKRLPTHQHFLPTPSDFNTPSSYVSTTRNDSLSPQSHTSPIISDVCTSSQNGVRNASTTMKTKDIDTSNGNHFNDKYAFTLDFSSPVSKTKLEQNRNLNSQHYTFDMSNNDEEDLHSPFELDVPICESQPMKKIQNDFLIDRMLKDETNSNYSSQHRSINQSSYTNVLSHPSPLVTPSSDLQDIDALSDAGTYIIEDDVDIAHDDEPEQDIEPKEDTQVPSSPLSSTSSPFKRYATTKRNRHGTFDIHGIASSITTTSATHTVNRPIVDLNIPTHDLSSPSSSSSVNLSSSSSLLSLPTESENSIRKEPEGASHQINDNQSSNGLAYTRQRPNNLLSQRPVTPPQNQIKPAECFVISPTFDTKPFPNSIGNGPRRKLDAQWKSKLSTSVIPTKDTNSEISSKQSSPSPPPSPRSNQSDTDRYSFRLRQPQQPRNQDTKLQQPRYLDPKQPTSQHQQQSSLSSSSNSKSSHQNSEYPSSKTSLRPHSSINDQTHSSPFQRNATIRQTMPANTQYNRPMSSSTNSKYLDDNEDISSAHPSLTKVYMNKSFALRRQRSNLIPSTTKPVQQIQSPQQQHHQQQQSLVSKALPSRQLVKPTPSVPSTNNSTGQTNRAVELRRARAQAKIEELSQRTRRQLQKTEQHNDIMSASWHSNASNTSKKDLFSIRANPRSNNTNHLSTQKQDLSKTRTISASSHHRSSSASPNPLGESVTTPTVIKSSKYRKGMTSSVTDEAQYQRMHGSTFSEGDRCELLRDDGQRLAIKLIQLSSGILAKLKPNNITDDSDSSVRELEQLVEQLQTVNRTLSTIDASLTAPINNEPLI